MANASGSRRTARAARSKPPAALLLAVAAMLGPSAAGAQSTDAAFGTDKALHFGLSAPFGMLGASFAGADASTATRLAYGTLIGSLPGLAKELYDMQGRGDPSARDMAFNVLGAALGALVADCCLIRPLTRGDRIDGIGVEYRIDF
jgi:VanZ family protein